MTPELLTENRLSDHAARIWNLEESQARADLEVRGIRESVDSLKFWIMGTLAAAVGGLLLQVLGKPH
jgi:hypothetical protein